MHTKTYTIDGDDWNIKHNPDWSGDVEFFHPEEIRIIKMPGAIFKAIAEDLAEERLRELAEKAIAAMMAGK